MYKFFYQAIVFTSLFFILLIGAGKVFDVYSKNYRVERSEKNYQYKKYLGLIGKDSEQVVVRRLIDSTLVTNNKETIRSGFRVVDTQPKTYLDGGYIFYGGSNMYGYGLDNNETLPSSFQRYTKKKVFNMSQLGWGIHQLLWILENNQYEDIISQADYLVYGFIDHHISRLSHSLDSILTIDYNYDTAAYRVVGEELEFKGTYREVRPYASKIKELVASNSILKHILLKKRNATNYLNEKNIELFCKIITRIQELLLKRSIKLIIFNYSSANIQKEILACLPENQEILDFNEVYKKLGDKRVFPGDWHPAGIINKSLAKEIYFKLND